MVLKTYMTEFIPVIKIAWRPIQPASFQTKFSPVALQPCNFYSWPSNTRAVKYFSITLIPFDKNWDKLTCVIWDDYKTVFRRQRVEIINLTVDAILWKIFNEGGVEWLRRDPPAGQKLETTLPTKHVVYTCSTSLRTIFPRQIHAWGLGI